MSAAVNTMVGDAKVTDSGEGVTVGDGIGVMSMGNGVLDGCRDVCGSISPFFSAVQATSHKLKHIKMTCKMERIFFLIVAITNLFIDMLIVKKYQGYVTLPAKNVEILTNV